MKKLIFLLLCSASLAYGQYSGFITANPSFTGTSSLDNYSIARTAHGAIGSTETFDAATGFHTATLDAACTVVLDGFAGSGKFSAMTIRFTQDATGGRLITWPAEVVTKPVINPQAGSITHVTLETSDGGTEIFAYSDFGGFSAALGTDDTFTGEVITGLNCGATVAQWDALYLGAAGTWLKADANGSGTFPARGLAVADGTDSAAPFIVLTHGTVRNDAWNWTPGAALFLDKTTAGALIATAPNSTGDAIQQVGFALTADIIFVDFGSGAYILSP